MEWADESKGPVPSTTHGFSYKAEDNIDFNKLKLPVCQITIFI